MKVGIMGLGFVGNAVKEVLQEKHELFLYDPFREGYQNQPVLSNAEVIFLCVPTPMLEDGSQDEQYIYSAMKTIGELGTNPVICIKSTVVPGTSKKIQEEFKLKVVNNPEFLNERTAIEDMRNADRIILGGDEEATEIVKQVFLPILPNAIYKKLKSEESEMVKHVTNAFLASQVGFANEIYKICKVLDIEYDKIKETLALDKRLGRPINVPGPDEKFGFGGSCLPKDLNSLICNAKKHGYDPSLLNELWKFNQEIRD